MNCNGKIISPDEFTMQVFKMLCIVGSKSDFNSAVIRLSATATPKNIESNMTVIKNAWVTWRKSTIESQKGFRVAHLEF
jgi:hypothetical protein